MNEPCSSSYPTSIHEHAGRLPARVLEMLTDLHNRTILFRSGRFIFVTYGLVNATAFVAGALAALTHASLTGLDPSRFLLFSTLFLLPAVLLGSRLFSLLLEWRELCRWPLQTLVKPGYMLHGGVLGGAAAVLAYSSATDWPALALMDAWAFALPLGESIARIGCHVYGCCWGRETEGRLAIRYTSEHAKVLRLHPHLRGKKTLPGAALRLWGPPPPVPPDRGAASILPLPGQPRSLLPGEPSGHPGPPRAVPPRRPREASRSPHPHHAVQRDPAGGRPGPGGRHLHLRRRRGPGPPLAPGPPGRAAGITGLASGDLPPGSGGLRRPHRQRRLVGPREQEALTMTDASVDGCRLCGECLARCPELGLSPERAVREKERINRGEISTWLSRRCTGCFSCDLHCPEKVGPSGAIVRHWQAQQP